MANLNKCYKKAEVSNVLIALLTVAGLTWNSGASAAQTPLPVVNSPYVAQQTSASAAMASAATSPIQTQELRTRQTLERIHTAMIEAEKRRVALTRPDAAVPPSLIEQWGVQVIGVNYTAGGFLLDFRFRVLDASKAEVLFDSRIKPYLKSEQSGTKLSVPTAAKIGALRTSKRGPNIQDGKIYAMMFANPGYSVKPGQKVSVVVGDFSVEHLTVRGQVSQKPGRAL